MGEIKAKSLHVQWKLFITLCILPQQNTQAGTVHMRRALVHLRT